MSGSDILVALKYLSFFLTIGCISPLTAQISTNESKKKYDPIGEHLNDSLDYEVKFNRLDDLMHEALNMLDTNSPEEVDRYVKENFDHAILSKISDSRYLASPAYKNLIGFSYSFLFYLVKYDDKVNPGSKQDRYGVYLDKIMQVFDGEVRDYVLYQFINLNLVEAVNSYEKFRQRSTITLPFLYKIKSGTYRDKLILKIRDKETALGNFKAGDAAPSFTLADSAGQLHALSDFRGKIVVLDFWASWCGPCRKETPFLKTLYAKYKSDNRLVLISIAVHDKKEPWLKALKIDQADWLQLFDGAGNTGETYFTNAIPKFVIIDQHGKIFDYQAPDPSDGNKLESLIEAKLKAF